MSFADIRFGCLSLTSTLAMPCLPVLHLSLPSRLLHFTRYTPIRRWMMYVDRNHTALFGSESLLISLILILVGAIIISKLNTRKLKLPPGPPSLPIVGNWLQVGNDLNHHNLAKLAQKYGDVFLLKMGQRNCVIVSSPELAKDVLLTQGIAFGSRTRNVVFDIFSGEGKDLVFTVYGEHWKRMRRIVTPALFSNRAVQQARGGWEEEIQLVVKELQANETAKTSGIVIRRRLQLMMYNILYRLMFDRRFDGADDPLFVSVRALNGERSRLGQSFEYNYGDFIPFLRPLMRGYLKLCQEVKDKRLALFKHSFVDQHRKMLEKCHIDSHSNNCAIDHLLEAEKRGEINEENVLYIIENLNIAAIENTLWSTEWAIAELVNNPDIQTKLRDELDSVLGKGVLITEPDISKLKYLNAIVKETLRLHMSIPFPVPHMNLHQAKLAGYDIPAESKILVNAWWIANNPKYWDKPQVFNPERFLDGKIEASGNDFRFLPFGAGRRSCPGVILAMPILSLVIGQLVTSFELLPPPGSSILNLSEIAGQFSLRIANHSTIVVKPRI